MNRLALLLCVLTTAAGCKRAPEVTPPAQIAKAEAALAAAKVKILTGEETRVGALRTAMNLPSVREAGAACPVPVRVVASSKGIQEAVLKKARATDEESAKEGTQSGLGGPRRRGAQEERSPIRVHEREDARFISQQTSIVARAEALVTPSRRASHDLQTLASYARELADPFASRYRPSAKGEEIAAAVDLLGSASGLELIVVEDAHRAPVAGDGMSRGYAYVYEPASGKVLCAGAYQAQNTDWVSRLPRMDQVLDLETETLRAAATHLFALSPEGDAGTK